jgi:hypothetical protein
MARDSRSDSATGISDVMPTALLRALSTPDAGDRFDHLTLMEAGLERRDKPAWR